MVLLETVILAALVVFNIILVILTTRKLNATLDLLFQALESRIQVVLSELVESFGENLIENFEPPNPIQAAIGQMIADRIRNPAGEITEVIKVND